MNLYFEGIKSQEDEFVDGQEIYQNNFIHILELFLF